MLEKDKNIKLINIKYDEVKMYRNKQFQNMQSHLDFFIRGIEDYILHNDLKKANLLLNEAETIFGPDNEKLLDLQNIILGWIKDSYTEQQSKYDLIQSAQIHKLNNLKNSYDGGTCVILGNTKGPLRFEFEILKNAIIFGFNFNNFRYDDIKICPDYYLLNDDDLKNGYEFLPENFKHTTFFASQLDDIRFTFPEERLIYLNIINDDSEYDGYPLFSFDPSKLLWSGSSISYIYLQLAYYMGFKQIMLLGFDHDFIPAIKELYENNENPYADDANYHNADYLPNILIPELKAAEKMRLAFQKAAYVYSRIGGEVIDITPGSEIDILPYKNQGEVEQIINKITNLPTLSNDSSDFDISLIVYVDDLKKLNQFIESIYLQTNVTPQIILCSSKNLEAKIHSIIDQSQYLIDYCCDENISYACNTALKIAKAKYIIFCNLDEYFCENFLSEALCRIINTNSNMIIFEQRIVYGDYSISDTIPIISTNSTIDKISLSSEMMKSMDISAIYDRNWLITTKLEFDINLDKYDRKFINKVSSYAHKINYLNLYYCENRFDDIKDFTKFIIQFYNCIDDIFKQIQIIIPKYNVDYSNSLLNQYIVIISNFIKIINICGNSSTISMLLRYPRKLFLNFILNFQYDKNEQINNDLKFIEDNLYIKQ